MLIWNHKGDRFWKVQVLILLRGNVSPTLDFVYYHKSHSLFNKYQSEGNTKGNRKNHNLHNSILFDTQSYIKFIPSN